jgi:hypothetical protein
MMSQRRSIQTIGIIIAIVGIALLEIYHHLGSKMTKIHTLESPLLLAGAKENSPFHLLPAGTTLYFDQSYPEGFTRYIVYVNVDHYPLETQELDDPTLIIPITAFPLDKEDLKRLLVRNPITKAELASILKSGQLSKDEIRELLMEYSK